MRPREPRPGRDGSASRQTLEASFTCSKGTVKKRVNFAVVKVNRETRVSAWKAVLTAPSGCKRGGVAIAYGGDQAFGPQRVAKGVGRR